jgi:hypothetical protein
VQLCAIELALKFTRDEAFSKKESSLAGAVLHFQKAGIVGLAAFSLLA